MSKAAALKISRDNAVKVENFRQSLYHEAENLFSSFIPLKIIQLDALLRDDALSITDMSSLQAPLDIPIPDPPAPEDEEMETDKNEEEEKKKKKAPKCGFIKGNEKIMLLLDRVQQHKKSKNNSLRVLTVPLVFASLQQHKKSKNNSLHVFTVPLVFASF
ncbi:proteasome activator complex subunit 2-like [Fundulus heteroclitus]|uniref:proteasome activator complex subunit 2-like n=1 Tax=Fundulus heteroclitus TaxID=8078 RepID=UPI00165A3BEE|nr:proteasome activator complex subunit 2-like [Fundulus heteroclitus]